MRCSSPDSLAADSMLSNVVVGACDVRNRMVHKGTEACSTRYSSPRGTCDSARLLASSHFFSTVLASVCNHEGSALSLATASGSVVDVACNGRPRVYILSCDGLTSDTACESAVPPLAVVLCRCCLCQRHNGCRKACHSEK